MKKGMCIAYEVGSGLYINITNRCSNRCSFCIRNNGDGAYGSDSLWLIREPSREEIFEAVFKRELSKYDEIVFCGYGEPSYRLDECIALAKEIKSRYPGMKTRINTNGQSDLILECDSAPLYKDAFDTVSISLNTCDAEKYDAMCHPVYKLDAFEAILKFAQNVKNYVQNVTFSVVRESLSEEELSECFKIAEKLQIPLRVRTYIGA
jgi:TatD family-associated radical SAM protein